MRGLESSSRWGCPTGPPPPVSSHCSSARLTLLQSSTVTSRGGQSILTWTSGRFGVPPMRRSARSKPIASSRLRKASTRLSVSMEKKARAELRPLQGGNVAGVETVSTYRAPQIGYHPAIPPARCPVRVKPLPAFRTAPGRNRHLLDSQVMRLLRQRGPATQLHRTLAGRHPEPDRDLRPYLIAVTTNPHATMHYDVARCLEAAPFE